MENQCIYLDVVVTSTSDGTSAISDVRWSGNSSSRDGTCSVGNGIVRRRERVADDSRTGIIRRREGG